MARSANGPQQTIGTRYPAETVAAVEADRKRLGLELSEWMRAAVGRMLEARVSPAEVEPYRRQVAARAG